MSDSDPKNTRRLERLLGLAVLFLLLAGCFVVMRPFLSAAMWAVVLCSSLWPIHPQLTARRLGFCLAWPAGACGAGFWHAAPPAEFAPPSSPASLPSSFRR